MLKGVSYVSQLLHFSTFCSMLILTDIRLNYLSFVLGLHGEGEGWPLIKPTPIVILVHK